MYRTPGRQKHLAGLWSGLAFISLSLGACSSVQDVSSLESRGRAVYQQNADGLVELEAENYHGRTARNAQHWQLVSGSAARRGKAVQALPDRGVLRHEDYAPNSPHLGYKVNFERAGVYDVRVRGRAKRGAVGSSDSVYVGLDGNAVNSADNLAGFEARFSWRSRTVDGAVATIGVNTHLHYQTTVYDTRYEDLIKPKLLELGVRHIRDSAHTYRAANRETFYYRRLRELGAAGLDFNLITSLPTSYTEGTDYTRLAEIVAWTDGAVTSFEGVNEPDLLNDDNWVALTVAAQKELYRAVKGNPSTRTLSVLGPSPTKEVERLGDLSNYLDYGSIHPYPGGKMPTGSEYGQSTEIIVQNAAVSSGAKPVMVTETGYHNALTTRATHPPASETVTAKYLPRLLLEHFNMGVPRSYVYELIDSIPSSGLENPEAHFGLLRHDGSEKPVFRALKNLIGLLADSGSFTPGTLDFSLAGDTAGVHHTLLQKGDGTFYLAVWLEKPSWNRDARRNIGVPAQQVTLTFGSPVADVTVHTLTDSGEMVAQGVTLDNHRLTLEVLDTVRVLELRP